MLDDRRKADQSRAIEHIESSIETMNERMGDDCDWVRCRRLIGRSLDKLKHDWNILPLLPYHEYLKTLHWEECRKRALQEANYRCQTCNAGDCELHTHHRSYGCLGNEQRGDLIVLCKDCHTLFHQRREFAETESRRYIMPTDSA